MRPNKQEIIDMLNTRGEENLKALFARAYEVKKKYVGTKVYFRGLIEISNICSKNCYYCGIRSGIRTSRAIPFPWMERAARRL